MYGYRELICALEQAGGRLTYIGKTQRGYPIPMLTKGTTAERILLVGAVHAREHITTDLLLALFAGYEGDYTIDCIPMLNIDGVFLAKGGLNALKLKPKERDALLALNGGSADFSLWKANIRGVDLNVNYDADWGTGAQNVWEPRSANYVGACPASEPETRALLPLLDNPHRSLVVAYHSKGEEVYYGYKEHNAYRPEAARYADHLGYALKETPGSAGGIKDYFTKTTRRLGLTVEVGRDDLPHPYPLAELPALIQQHAGSLPLLAELARGLWTKYTSC